MSSRSRLLKEIKEAARDADPTIRLAPDGENLLRWSATLKGPEDTPFETGTFVVRFSLPESYPLAPPRAAFETKIFHPNVHWKTGEICLDILKDAWSPAWTLHSVCRAVLALLCNPEPDSPLNCDAGNMLRARDDIAYWSTARMYTRREAGGSAMAKTAWPPIRADREMADDERGETFTSAGRRRALPGTSDASLDPKTRGGRADGDAQNQKENAADVASGSGERAGTGVVDEGNVSFAETRKAKTDAFADAPARDPRAAAAAAAAARFEASRLARDAAGAG
jgi:peroxin-4